MTEVLPDDAYKAQATHMLESKKPRQLLAWQWYLQMSTIHQSYLKNPRANGMVEHIYKVLADVLRVQIASHCSIDKPMEDMTSAAAHAIQATVQGITSCNGQLVYENDAMLCTQVEAEAETIQQRREAAITKNNIRENKRRIAYKNKIGDKVLVLSRALDPTMQLLWGRTP